MMMMMQKNRYKNYSLYLVFHWELLCLRIFSSSYILFNASKGLILAKKKKERKM